MRAGKENLTRSVLLKLAQNSSMALVTITEDSISPYCILQENYLMLNQVTSLQVYLLQKLLTLGPKFLCEICSDVNFLSNDALHDRFWMISYFTSFRGCGRGFRQSLKFFLKFTLGVTTYFSISVTAFNEIKYKNACSANAMVR